MIVWEVYAKRLNRGAEGTDLVELVKRMSTDLTPVQAVCEFSLVSLEPAVGELTV